jgi:hypothetical protein
MTVEDLVCKLSKTIYKLEQDIAVLRKALVVVTSEDFVDRLLEEPKSG